MAAMTLRIKVGHQGNFGPPWNFLSVSIQSTRHGGIVPSASHNRADRGGLWREVQHQRGSAPEKVTEANSRPQQSNRPLPNRHARCGPETCESRLGDTGWRSFRADCEKLMSAV